MTSWQQSAPCAGADPEAWFPEPGAPAREAKRICRRCPFRDRCLADALARGERYGVWGGVSISTYLRGRDPQAPTKEAA